jgi:amino acid transporter
MTLALMTTLSVALIAIGMLILFDYHRIPSRFTSLVDKWWKAGPIRRRFKPRGPSFRFMGAPLVFMGLVIFVSAMF